MKIKKRNLFLVLIIVVALFFLFLSIRQQTTNGAAIMSYGNVETSIISGTRISYDNLVGILSGNQMIKDLPSDAVLLLRFYNFNSGERAWEKSYVLRKSEVKEGFVDKADLTLALHSKYLSQLTTDNFCSIIKSAKQNGDLGAYSELSTAALLWKFKSMLKYRECFGF